MAMDTFSPFETNHTDISASIPPSQATVYLQWHFSSFHCVLTWVIPLYLLIKMIFLKKRPPHTLDTFSFLYPLCLMLSIVSILVCHVLLTWLIMSNKDPSLIRGMSSILYWDIRSQIPSVQKTGLMHYKNALCGEAGGCVWPCYLHVSAKTLLTYIF